MADPPGAAPLESVHSPTVSAHISHAVIASYAAAAARDVPGVRGITDGHLGLRERRAELDRAPRGIRVLPEGDEIALHIRLILDYGCDVAAVTDAVEVSVRDFLRSMIDLEVAELELTVDDVVDVA